MQSCIHAKITSHERTHRHRCRPSGSLSAASVDAPPGCLPGAVRALRHQQSGYVSVTLAFLLDRSGLSAIEITTIIAGTLWVQTWKILWAPVVDAVGNPKLWYGLGATVVGLTILTMSMLPATAAGVSVLAVLAAISSAAATLVSMSSEIFMAQSVPPPMRGRASGWAQAGNLGGSGVGGGPGLLLAEHYSQPWISGGALALICLACWACVRLVPAARRTRSMPTYVEEIKGVVGDVWAVARSRAGYLATAKVTMRKAYGHRTFRIAELSPYHVLGKLPEPKLAHRFF